MMQNIDLKQLTKGITRHPFKSVRTPFKLTDVATTRISSVVPQQHEDTLMNYLELSSKELLKMRAEIDKALVVVQKKERKEFLEWVRGEAEERGYDLDDLVNLKGAGGRKIAPQYEGPNGELWTGRGRTPRWVQSVVGDEPFKMKNPKHYMLISKYKIVKQSK